MFVEASCHEGGFFRQKLMDCAHGHRAPPRQQIGPTTHKKAIYCDPIATSSYSSGESRNHRSLMQFYMYVLLNFTRLLIVLKYGAYQLKP